MSTAVTKAAQEPKRKRGHIRVAAIKETAVNLFMEKGYDAATMTEIAERSGTAIASLYRFFPSKEILADALLHDYATFVFDKLAELRDRPERMSPEQLAGALVDFRLELQTQRRFAIGLVDAHGAKEKIRQQFRNEMIKVIAEILRKNLCRLTKTGAEKIATTLVYILKGVSQLDREKPAAQRAIAVEIGKMIGCYLASVNQD